MRLFSIRWYGRWFAQGMIGDSAHHWAVIETLRKGSPFVGVPQFVMQLEPDSYPIAFHRFARRWTSESLRRRPWLPNLVVYVAGTTVFALYAYYVAHRFLTDNPAALTALAVAILITARSNLCFNGNAILYIGLSERLLAKTVSNLFFLTLAIGLSFDDVVSLTIAAALGAIAGVTSKFGRQVAWFVTPLYALLSLDWRPLAVLAVATLGSVALDGRYFLRGIRHMYTFWQAYNRFSKHSRYVQPSLSRMAKLHVLFGRGVHWRARLHEAQSQEPTRALFEYPDVILVSLVSLAGLSNGIAGLRPLVIAVLVVWAATATRSLCHFGEATRYLGYTLPMIGALALANWLLTTPDALAFVLAGGYVLWLVSTGALALRDWRVQKLPDHDELGDFISRLDLRPGDCVFPIPFTLGSNICVRAKDVRAITIQAGAVTPELYQRYCDEVPLLKRDWRPLFEEFRVTHVIGLKQALGILRDLVGWEYDLGTLQKLAETEKYVAYKIPAAGLHAA